MKYIYCKFQDETKVKEFCEHNVFPVFDHRCSSFNIVTKTIKNRRIEVKNKNKESLNKFIKRNENDETKTSLYPMLDKVPTWRNMPIAYSINSDNKEFYARVTFEIPDDYDFEKLKNIFWFAKNLTKATKSLSFSDEKDDFLNSIVTINYTEKDVDLKYPVYVVSKGREWLKDGTSGVLTSLCIPHYVVVEPQEVDGYKKSIENEFATILPLDMEYKKKYDTFSDMGQTMETGPGAARNFVWDHSTKNGFAWHWVMDDNAFFSRVRLFNHRFINKSKAMFRAVEEYTDKFSNVAQIGLNYTMFSVDNHQNPYVPNTRIYSFLLNSNTAKDKNGNPYRWRGRYNEDTDLSLRMLKDGWCTMNHECLLMDKIGTQSLGGGNTEIFYAVEGTTNKSQMLYDMHPDCVNLVTKYGRAHHQVNYHVFQQQPKLKPEFEKELQNLPIYSNHEIVLLKVDDKEDIKLSNTELKLKYKDRIHGPQQYLLIDDDSNVDDIIEKIKKKLSVNYTPCVLTGIFGFKVKSNVTEACEQLRIPCVNNLYNYDKFGELNVRSENFILENVSIIAKKDTLLDKVSSKFKNII